MKHRLSHGLVIDVRRMIIKGVAVYPDSNGKRGQISISEAVAPGSRGEMEALLHECAHQESPTSSEEIIRAVANSQTRLLWKDGWRKPKRRRRTKPRQK